MVEELLVDSDLTASVETRLDRHEAAGVDRPLGRRVFHQNDVGHGVRTERITDFGLELSKRVVAAHLDGDGVLRFVVAIDEFLKCGLWLRDHCVPHLELGSVGDPIVERARRCKVLCG